MQSLDLYNVYLPLLNSIHDKHLSSICKSAVFGPFTIFAGLLPMIWLRPSPLPSWTPGWTMPILLFGTTRNTSAGFSVPKYTSQGCCWSRSPSFFSFICHPSASSLAPCQKQCIRFKLATLTHSTFISTLFLVTIFLHVLYASPTCLVVRSWTDLMLLLILLSGRPL